MLWLIKSERNLNSIWMMCLRLWSQTLLLTDLLLEFNGEIVIASRHVDLIKQDLMNHFYTRKGERVMDPEFGSIIWDLLYEPIDESTKEDLVEDCKTIIASDPRVQLIDLILDDVGNGIRVDIQLNVLPFNQQASMQVNFERETL